MSDPLDNRFTYQGWKVWKMDDYCWMTAPSLDEAKSVFLSQYDGELDDVYPPFECVLDDVVWDDLSKPESERVKLSFRIILERHLKTENPLPFMIAATDC